MTELRRRFIDDMTLHGLAPTTQNVYVNAVRQLAARYRRSPDQLSEQELRDYFTYLIKEKRLASSTLRTQIFGIKFLYTKTLQKPWPTLKLLRARRREKLPVVLSTPTTRGPSGTRWTRSCRTMWNVKSGCG